MQIVGRRRMACCVRQVLMNDRGRSWSDRLCAGVSAYSLRR